MAYTYEGTPVISKLTVNGESYFLKDADVRAILDTFNNSVVTAQIGAITENNKLVYSQNIKSYVDNAISINSKLTVIAVDELPEASQNTMGAIYLVPADKTGVNNIKDEYITIQSGTDPDYTYSWEKIGSTEIDLSNYVSNVSYVAASHTLQQTKNGAASTVHQFGAFADANTGTASIKTVDSASGTVTPSGTVAVTLKDDTAATDIDSTGSFTPTGTVTVASYTPEGDVTINDYTPAGSVTVASYTPAGTVNITEGDAISVQQITGVGTLPSLTMGTTQFATAGVTAAVSGETLTFSNASKAAATATFNAGTLPTRAAVSIPTVEGATFIGTAKAPTATFAGTKATLSGAFTGTAKAPTATFAGKAGTVNVTGEYNKQVINTATFTGTQSTVTVNLTKTNKSITVNPV